MRTIIKNKILVLYPIIIQKSWLTYTESIVIDKSLYNNRTVTHSMSSKRGINFFISTAVICILFYRDIQSGI